MQSLSDAVKKKEIKRIPLHQIRKVRWSWTQPGSCMTQMIRYKSTGWMKSDSQLLLKRSILTKEGLWHCQVGIIWISWHFLRLKQNKGRAHVTRLKWTIVIGLFTVTQVIQLFTLSLFHAISINKDHLLVFRSQTMTHVLVSVSEGPFKRVWIIQKESLTSSASQNQF